MGPLRTRIVCARKRCETVWSGTPALTGAHRTCAALLALSAPGAPSPRAQVPRLQVHRGLRHQLLPLPDGGPRVRPRRVPRLHAHRAVRAGAVRRPGVRQHGAAHAAGEEGGRRAVVHARCGTGGAGGRRNAAPACVEGMLKGCGGPSTRQCVPGRAATAAARTAVPATCPGHGSGRWRPRAAPRTQSSRGRSRSPQPPDLAPSPASPGPVTRVTRSTWRHPRPPTVCAARRLGRVCGRARGARRAGRGVHR